MREPRLRRSSPPSRPAQPPCRHRPRCPWSSWRRTSPRSACGCPTGRSAAGGSDKYLGLGNGVVVDVSRAVPVVGLEGSKRLVGGVYSVCSLSGEGVLSCWGAGVCLPGGGLPRRRAQAEGGGEAGHRRRPHGPRGVHEDQRRLGLPPSPVGPGLASGRGAHRVADPVVPHLPVASGPARRWAPLVVDQHHTSYSACGIDAKGSVLCAGSNEAGELGTGKEGASRSRSSPRRG